MIRFNPIVCLSLSWVVSLTGPTVRTIQNVDTLGPFTDADWWKSYVVYPSTAE